MSAHYYVCRNGKCQNYDKRTSMKMCECGSRKKRFKKERNK